MKRLLLVGALGVASQGCFDDDNACNSPPWTLYNCDPAIDDVGCQGGPPYLVEEEGRTVQHKDDPALIFPFKCEALIPQCEHPYPRRRRFTCERELDGYRWLTPL